jgi:polar amino acid transport system substrate-binding protein
LALLLLFLLQAGVCVADVHRSELTVVYTEWRPYTYKEAEEARGLEIEVVKAVLERMRIQPRFVHLPWNRCLKMIEDGGADALVSLLRTPEREAYTIFPAEHISVSRTVLFTRTGKEIRYRGSLKDLRNFRIGVISGFSYGKTFDSATYLKKDEVVNAEKLVEMVVSGRHDLGVENQVVLITEAKKQGVEKKIQILSPPIHTQRLYVGFSRKRDLRRLATGFSETLAGFKKTEEYDVILRKYGLSRSDMGTE